MIQVLPRETLLCVRVLFQADHHRPELAYTADGAQVAMQCPRCQAVIRWHLVEGTWKPDTTGYVAGVRCPGRPGAAAT